MTEIVTFFTQLGLAIRIAGFLSIGWGMIDLGSSKKNNDGKGQDLAIYAIVFGVLMALWGPKLMAMIGAQLQSLS